MTQLISHRKEKPLTPEDRQRHLIEASNDYMTGKMSREDFRKAEHRYMTDYNGITLELGRVSRIPKVVLNRLAAAISRRVKQAQ